MTAFKFAVGQTAQVTSAKGTRTGEIVARRMVGPEGEQKAEYKLKGDKNYLAEKSLSVSSDTGSTEAEAPAPTNQVVETPAAAPAPAATQPTAKRQRKEKIMTTKTDAEKTPKELVNDFLIAAGVAVNPKFADEYIGNHKVSLEGFELPMPKLNFNAVVKRVGKAIGKEGAQADLQAEDESIVGTEYTWKFKGKTLTLHKDYADGTFTVSVK